MNTKSPRLHNSNHNSEFLIPRLKNLSKKVASLEIKRLHNYFVQHKKQQHEKKFFNATSMCVQFLSIHRLFSYVKTVS